MINSWLLWLAVFMVLSRSHYTTPQQGELCLFHAKTFLSLSVVWIEKTIRTFCLVSNQFTISIFISFYYRASICEGGLGSRNSVCLSVCLFVRPSVTRVDCDKTKWRTADIFIPHERAITLLLWYQERLVGDAPFPLKSAFKVTHPF